MSEEQFEMTEHSMDAVEDAVEIEQVLDLAIKRANIAERVIKTLSREFRSDGSGMRSANYWRKRLSTLMNED